MPDEAEPVIAGNPFPQTDPRGNEPERFAAADGYATLEAERRNALSAMRACAEKGRKHDAAAWAADVLRIERAIAAKRRKSHIDPKLSDCGARRGSCVVERGRDIQATEKGGSEKTGPS